MGSILFGMCRIDREREREGGGDQGTATKVAGCGGLIRSKAAGRMSTVINSRKSRVFRKGPHFCLSNSCQFSRNGAWNKRTVRVPRIRPQHGKINPRARKFKSAHEMHDNEEKGNC